MNNINSLQGVNIDHVTTIRLYDKKIDTSFRWKSKEIKIGKRGKPDKIIREAGIYYHDDSLAITKDPENRYINGNKVWVYPKLEIRLISKEYMEFYFKTYEEGCVFAQNSFKGKKWMIQANFRPKLKQ